MTEKQLEKLILYHTIGKIILMVWFVMAIIEGELMVGGIFRTDRELITLAERPDDFWIGITILAFVIIMFWVGGARFLRQLHIHVVQNKKRK